MWRKVFSEKKVIKNPLDLPGTELLYAWLFQAWKVRKKILCVFLCSKFMGHFEGDKKHFILHPSFSWKANVVLLAHLWRGLSFFYQWQLEQLCLIYAAIYYGNLVLRKAKQYTIAVTKFTWYKIMN